VIASQLGGLIVAGFVFFAFVAAMSRLLKMKEIPDYIDNVTRALSNLYQGAFGR
jgi:hypothetical protein